MIIKKDQNLMKYKKFEDKNVHVMFSNGQYQSTTKNFYELVFENIFYSNLNFTGFLYEFFIHFRIFLRDQKKSCQVTTKPWGGGGGDLDLWFIT